MAVNPLCAATQGMIHFTTLLCGVQGLLQVIAAEVVGAAVPLQQLMRMLEREDEELLEILAHLISSGIIK